MYQDASSVSLSSFSLAQIRHIVKDLFTPKPWIYWTDFLASMTLGSLCFVAVRKGIPESAIIQSILFLASGVFFYRATLFTHELVHLRENKFRLFRIVWNLLCGIPFLIPTFMYYTHVDHHMRSHYGTHRDGEYLPFGTGRPIDILLYLLQPFVIPVVAVFRFLVLTPLCWLSPALRRWTQQHASSMVMDPSYIRPLPTAKTLWVFRWQGTACFLLTLAVAIRLMRGAMPVGMLVQCYLTGALVLMINNVRTLGAHRYITDRREVTFVEQLLDSINYPAPSLLTPLWAPVGLRYHALHHVCPSLPYHAMGEAHRRLMEQLPADSPYRQTNSPSLWAALRQLWATATRNYAARELPAADQTPRIPQRASAPRLSGLGAGQREESTN
jgi:fatty acid desaturase